MIGEIVIVIIGLIIGSGILLLLFRNHEASRNFAGILQNQIKGRMNKKLRKAMIARKENNLLSGTQYYLDRGVYEALRTGAFGIFMLLGIAGRNVPLVSVGIILYLISYPKEYTNKDQKLPFYYFCQAFRQTEQTKKDDELLESLSILKNLMVQHRNEPQGADSIIDYLAQDANLTQPAYQKMLMQMRQGKVKEGGAAFVEEIGTQFSKDYAQLLIQLDNLNPSEMEEAIISRQRYARETKTTQLKKRDELFSDLIYIPITITICVVFLNFILVAFYFDQQDVFNALLFHH